jgi:hypothetical protein
MIGLFYAILGAVLAGLTIERAKSKKRLILEEDNYNLVTRLVLESMLKQLDKLKTGFNDQGYYPFATLNLLDTSLVRLEPKISTIFQTGKNTAFQTDFVTLVTDLASLLQNIRGIENHRLGEEEKYNKAKVGDPEGDSIDEATRQYEGSVKFVDQQRSAMLVELVDAIRRCQAIIEKLRP